ncbi:PilN domain-containing protein [Oceanicoccus sagamiensis]|uniref:Pilus assembly protein PilN n=1 Tax=Oceanicoccus sagamiensis TaxID=716816 RepID=A0A1X9NE88_9GAMM|nr:PilN domain-containing protein [Oceanicoccus sagamiensis]ARN74205.1 pilus assembly protein PilN [Oceanicoccus sagamiensis]
MANINLLPWREERRQELKQAFLVVLGIVAAIGFALVVLADMAVNSAIDGQNARNQYLEKQIGELELQVKEIRELEKKKQELLDRMKVIQELQGNRPIIVRIFDEMVRSLPDGVFYQSLSRSNDAIKLQGIAESNNRISSLMRRVDKSEWFDDPNLTAVTANPIFGEQASEFTMSFNISTPSVIDEGEE